ncbi:uncharacterized protein KY384_005095 [Bacidia gigantensis]|uniref:uncharacterized protein n=1 Tax=Bacidia gigantensis TaxID=2732470 RepID=UPI001D040DAE|nr:uncharacterized protein KY384_005095 [Bacidia gigantensis]KAG8530592.1 hypothetical protein KY384_005095 [Bacidia gigantensis]
MIPVRQDDVKHQKLWDLLPHLAWTLMQHGVKGGTALVKRFAPDDKPDDTATVLVSTTKLENQDWAPAIAAMAEVLIENQLGEKTIVEILDDRAEEYFFPARTDTETQSKFREEWPSNIEPQMLEYLGNGPEWETLTVLNRGRTKEDSHLTVTVGITKKASHSWQIEKYNYLVNMLDSYNVGFAFKQSDLDRPSRSG